jgi:hypothetical protein
VTADPDRDRRRQLLDAVLTGELDPAAPAIVAACRADAGFAAELAQLQRLTRQLTEQGRHVRDDLTEPAPALETAAERAIRRLGAAAPARRRRPWVAAALAAAALVVAFVCWRARTTSDGAQHLGSFLVTPAADGRGLVFAHTLAPGEYFVLTIADGSGHTVFALPRWSASEWQPERELARRWARDWVVTVVAERSDAEPVRGMPLHDWMPGR